MNENLSNLFETRKTIRFIAKPEKNTRSIANFLGIKKKQNNDEKYKLLGRFLEDFTNILSLYKDIFFYENNSEFRDSFKIKYKFLQNHTRYDFYNIPKKEKIYNFKELNFIEDFLINYQEKLKNIYENLELYQSKSKESQNRYREIGTYLQRISGRNISTLKDLFEFLVKTNKVGIDKKIEEIKISIPKFEKSLINLLKEFGPNNGLEIAKGSFNYYILNKSGKEYFDKKIDSLKSEQECNLQESLFKITGKNKPELSLDETFFENIGLSKKDLEEMTLEDAYDYLKKFKAKTKSAFNQFVGNGYSYEDLINKVKRTFIDKENFEEMSVELFADIGEDKFEDFKKLTDEINNLGTEINKILEDVKKTRKNYEKQINKKKLEERNKEENRFMEKISEIEKKAKERGKYFNIPNEKVVYTQNYKNLCDFFGKIALKLGQNKAQILGYEKQIIDSEKLKFFAIISEKGNDKFLILIQKGGENYHRKAHNFLKENSENKDGNIKIHSFKSLTLRALQKLCFKEDKNILTGEKNEDNNTFICDVVNELSDIGYKKYLKLNRKGEKKELKRFDEFKIYDKNIKDKKEWKIDENLLIEFYKDVLKTKSAKSVLDLQDFGLENILNEDFTNLNEFELALEKVAYVKNTSFITEENYENFIKNHEAFEYKISSQDLDEQNEEKSNNKKHTKYWLDFWTSENKNNNYNTRINPEFSLYYILADENLKNKKENGLLKEPKKLESFKNRKLNDQLIFTTNFSLNSNHKLQDLAFLQSKDLKENIDGFNKNLAKNILEKYKKEDLWYFGIDRGINELATLSISKFLNKQNDKNVPNFEFAKIKCWKIKENFDKIKDIKIDERGITRYEFEKLEFENKNGYKRDFEVSKNVSYFLQKKEIFEEIETGIIDLTQAKLFGDKIILNGDKSSLLRLKELSAKRRIFELFSKGKIDKNSNLNFSKKVIHIIDNDNNEL